MSELLVGIAVLLLVAFGVHSCEESKWFKDMQANQAKYQKEQRTPHVIREADGCKVYAFERDGRDHYFTRCPSSVTTTESSWSVSCGKNCSRTETESIEVKP